MFISVEYFPESASTVTNCEQNRGCLHLDDKCKHDNSENITLGNAFGSDNVMKSVKSSGPNSTETVVVNMLQITKISDGIVEGESDDSSKNSSVSSLRRHCPVSSGQVDKYDLDLRFRPRHQSKIVSAKDCATFQKWNDQNCENFWFYTFGRYFVTSCGLKQLIQGKKF